MFGSASIRNVSRKTFFVLALLGIGVALVIKYGQSNTAPAPLAKEASSHIKVLSPSRIAITAGAPQLAYLKSEPTETFPLPLVEPLNARIAYNENNTARITSPIAARVIQIQAELGDNVKQGSGLVTLDAPDYAQAVADVRKAEADLALKDKQRQRAEILWRGEAIARREVDNAEADFQVAVAETQRARQRLANLTHGDKASTQQGLLTLRAPLNGTIVERHINPGSEVGTGDNQPLFVISNLNTLWVYVDLPERYLGKVEPGMNAILTADAYPAERFGGTVEKVSAVLDPTTRRFTVRCLFPNSELRLRPEMFAQVTFAAKNSLDVWRIPNSALIVQGIQQYAFIELQPGEYEKRSLDILSKDHRYSYVSGNLSGQRVVVKGALLLNAELLAGN
ncbi:efflux RND transporter periplasmic adaptor subunit [Parvibium lacunae]|uniref:Efflux RND transporter periplasmic adaptor subunit n=1 Tax=Parvibium lacunae TaxID=1888893 RepID=A0A368L3A1_9BURK|nr:efflux RND transporter periplasmic adaptor subunit [Parvibium lacunae]RCS58034.1 efflux RND transporter periplasmic adaptor subunit [Parvibium lacunae]